jgi:hypothetical protein
MNQRTDSCKKKATIKLKVDPKENQNLRWNYWFVSNQITEFELVSWQHLFVQKYSVTPNETATIRVPRTPEAVFPILFPKKILNKKS